MAMLVAVESIATYCKTPNPHNKMVSHQHHSVHKNHNRCTVQLGTCKKLRIVCTQTETLRVAFYNYTLVLIRCFNNTIEVQYLLRTLAQLRLGAHAKCLDSYILLTGVSDQNDFPTPAEINGGAK